MFSITNWDFCSQLKILILKYFIFRYYIYILKKKNTSRFVNFLYDLALLIKKKSIIYTVYYMFDGKDKIKYLKAHTSIFHNEIYCLLQ